MGIAWIRWILFQFHSLYRHQPVKYHAKISLPTRSCETKNRDTVEQPLVFHNNKYMGGVDQYDWLYGKYAVNIRGKKWY